MPGLPYLEGDLLSLRAHPLSHEETTRLFYRYHVSYSHKRIQVGT